MKSIDNYFKPEYYYYFDDRKNPKPSALNCGDEIVPGSHDRFQKINALKMEKIKVGSDDFMEQYGKIIHEMHSILKEELMAFGMNEHQASIWLEMNVNFNHVKEHQIGKDRFLSVDPVVMTHEELAEEIMQSLKGDNDND